MRGIESRINPKNLARTAALTALPLAAGLSACGDGATQSGMPAGLESPTRAPIAGPIGPTPEPGRTTITVPFNCPPTNPLTREVYNQEAEKMITGNTGVVIIEMKGLTCSKDSATSSGLLAIGRKVGENNFEIIEQFEMYGYSDGSPEVKFVTVPSCEGEYLFGAPLPNTNKIKGFATPDEKTLEIKPTFQLYEDCITTIYLGPDSPKDLN